MYRPTWAEISTTAFVNNVIEIRKLIGPKVRLLAVMKADGYGHGATALAPFAIKAGADMLGVSSLEEALNLRSNGITDPILILGGIYPLENFSVAVENNLTPTVASLEAAQALSRIAAQQKKKVGFHLKVDTGMGRIGVSPDAAKKIAEWVKTDSSVELAGVFSHFACADSDEAFTKKQMASFLDLKTAVRKLGFEKTVIHLANSVGTLTLPEARHDMVRTGLAIYGATQAAPQSASFKPVLSWQTRAIFLKKVPSGTPISYGQTFVTSRDSDIATLPVGYADGVPRSVSNKGFVLVKGTRCPIVGRVTMDHIMVDVTGLNVAVGEPVTLIGSQGGNRISVHDWADWADTITYEIFCGISKRVPRKVTS